MVFDQRQVLNNRRVRRLSDYSNETTREETPMKRPDEKERERERETPMETRRNNEPNEKSVCFKWKVSISARDDNWWVWSWRIDLIIEEDLFVCLVVHSSSSCREKVLRDLIELFRRTRSIVIAELRRDQKTFNGKLIGREPIAIKINEWICFWQKRFFVPVQARLD